MANNTIMKRKMNDIIGLLKRGDLQKIAADAKVDPSVVSNIIHGRRDIENYPNVSEALIRYVKNRANELTAESKLTVATSEVYSKLKMKPPTDQELLLRNLTAQKIARMKRADLLLVIQERGLRIKAKEFEDDDDLRDEVIEKLGLKAESTSWI